MRKTATKTKMRMTKSSFRYFVGSEKRLASRRLLGICRIAVAGAILGLGGAIESGCQKPRAASVPLPTASQATDWTLSTSDPRRAIDAYVPSSGTGRMIAADGSVAAEYYSGRYKNGVIMGGTTGGNPAIPAVSGYSQVLDLKSGTLETTVGGKSTAVKGSVAGYASWQKFWSDSDIEIDGDAEAQQATRAELFYLAGSGSKTTSIPPFGLSSNGYSGHIFWDAETWMLPALIAQHPDLARGMIAYRFQRLKQAVVNAKADKFPGAEYPWESADTGREEAPPEFAQERHITADVGLAVWQYYLWSGDKKYLRAQGWPILEACADYWAARASRGSDGKSHIVHVIGPDETSGVVDDDAWTNAAAAQCLRDAGAAADALGVPSHPNWSRVAGSMSLPRDSRTGIPIEHVGATDRLRAKQADTELLVYPLDLPMPPGQAAAILQFARQHTSNVGPAMTSSIDALISARLGLAQQSLDLFRASYQPFLRGPWNAFSEKRTRDSIYFCTGMGGCLQTVLYGFAGLNVASGAAPGQGTLIARSGDAALYAAPHLPPEWSKLVVRGVKFRGAEYDVTMTTGDKVSVQPRQQTKKA